MTLGRVVLENTRERKLILGLERRLLRKNEQAVLPQAVVKLRSQLRVRERGASEQRR